MAFDEAALSQISDEVKADPSFAEISKGDLNSTVKNLIDSQKTLGRAILLPDERDPEDKRSEKYNSIYEKLGRPKAHTDYKTEEIFGAEVELPQGKTERYLKAFHEAGLSTKQANRIVREYLADLSETTVTKEKAIEALSLGDPENNIQGWGEKVEAMVGVAKTALVKFDPDGRLSGWLESSGAGNAPEVLRFLHSVGVALAEDKTPARQELPGGPVGKDAAQSRLTEILNDKAGPYWNRKLAGHNEAVQEVAQLQAILHGTKVEAVTGTH